MAKARKGVSAWLVEWQWAGKHARFEGPRYLVLDRRYGARSVAKIVEILYAYFSYDLSEQVDLAAGRWKKPYRAMVMDFERIHCGHNPYLYAKRVRNLRVDQGEDGTERLAYKDIEVPERIREWIRHERARNAGQLGDQ